MDKQTQDKSSTDTKSVTGQDPDRYNAGYGSFNEEDYEKKEENSSAEVGANNTAPTGLSDKANIETGMNENKSTVSDEAAPSGTLSDKQTEPGKSQS